MKRHLLLLITAMLFSTATAFAQGGTTGPLTWSINDGTLIISGTGTMPDYNFWDNRSPWYEYRESFNACIIETGVVNVGKFAFDGCYNLTSITLSNSILLIDEGGFRDCGLSSIYIPSSITSFKYSYATK